MRRNRILSALRDAAATLALLVASSASAAPDASLTVGTLELKACGSLGGYCGTLTRALDPLGQIPGTIDVYFEFYPHSGAGDAKGVLVAGEGGPGFPTTESRAEYLAMFGGLREARDVVLMDNRGTGRSGAIDCTRVQREQVLTIASIGACGTELGRKAPLYSTAYAADDLAAILEALKAGPVDLYGDSYGTFFAQVFAVRHGDKLRTLTLDGAYPLVGKDLGWWANYAPAMRNKFDRACERSSLCRRTPGSSIEHIVPALKELRQRSVAATATDADGTVQHFTANPGTLATVMFGSAPAYATLRETDAAAQAFVQGDRLPLLRLMAEATAAVDSRDASRDPAKFSEGLAAAINCQDAPQVFDMRLQPEARRAARDRAFAARRRSVPDGEAPFTLDEYRAMPVDYAFLEQCVAWPVADGSHPASHVVPDNAVFPQVPVLVVSGELDNMTPMADGAAAAAQFPHARHQIIANGFHVNAMPHARSTCGGEIVRAFIADPKDDAAAARGARCAADAPPLRLAPPFVRGYQHAEPATATGTKAASPDALLLAGATVATLGDLLPRLQANSSGHGVGLRGGKFTVTTDDKGVSHARFERLKWADDLGLTGTLAWSMHGGEAVAHVRFHAKPGLSGRLTVRWPEAVADARARIDGRIGGVRILAESPAP